MTKVTPRLVVTEGMTVDEIMKRGSTQQKKIACVFDENSDGKLTGSEVKLFNSTSTMENADGSITFWTKFSSGKKLKNTIDKQNLMTETLKIEKEFNNDKVLKQKRNVNEQYPLRNIDKLVNHNLITGTRKYAIETGDDSVYLPEEDRKYDLKTYVTVDRYGREIEISEPNIECSESGCSLYGRVVRKNDTEIYYDKKGIKKGSLQSDGDKVKVLDAKGSLMYYYKYNDNLMVTVYDENKKEIGAFHGYGVGAMDFLGGKSFLKENGINLNY